MKETNTRSANKKITDINEGYSVSQRTGGSSMRRRRSSSAGRRNTHRIAAPKSDIKKTLTDNPKQAENKEVIDIKEHVQKREAQKKKRQKLKISFEIGGLDVPFLMLIIML